MKISKKAIDWSKIIVYITLIVIWFATMCWFFYQADRLYKENKQQEFILRGYSDSINNATDRIIVLDKEEVENFIKRMEELLKEENDDI